MDQVFEKLEFPKIKERIKRYCTSEMGKELVESMCFTSDLKEIKYNLDITSEFKNLLEADEPVPVDGIKDIRESIARSSIENSFLQPKDFLDILDTIRASRQLKTYFSRRKSKYILIYDLTENLFADKVLEFNIEKAIDENANIKDSASKGLREVRQKIINMSSLLNKELDKILKRFSEQEYTQEDLITQRDGRFVIPIKVEHKRHIPGFIHSASSSGATVFIEPAETLELNNELRSLQFEERREIEKILKDLTNLIRANIKSIHDSIKVLAKIDFIYAKAKYAIEIIADKPVIRKGAVKIRNGYHPILMQKHKRSEIVPLNFTIGEKFNTLIITGPNAGGKSVALKTIGVLTTMLQAGLLIPVSPDSEFQIFRKIFIDIGDEQSIENDLSTFSSHLLNLKSICDKADKDSLILLDEIGEGTDPLEGGAIAAAILEKLTNMRACTVATTHQSSLKVFAYQSDRIENGAMEFDQKTLTPTYLYREGIPGSSYAIEIAIRLGIGKDIIQKSREFIGEDKNKLEKVIGDLENRLQAYNNKLNEVNKESSELKILVQENKEKSKELKKEKNSIKSQALREAEGFVREMNSRIENVIKNIKEKEASKESIKQAKEVIQSIKDDFKAINERLSDPKETIKEYSVGEIIKLKDGHETGKIDSIDFHKHIVSVDFGKLKIEIPFDQIEKIDEVVESGYANRPHYMEFVEEKSVRTELDLRGKYGAEAIPIVDKFIDDAILKGLSRIDIIHGKGTGALRKIITDYLKDNHFVQSYRLGEWNEGGSGVTVVELNLNS